MSYAIVGFGEVGQALARMFARRGIEVVASRRSPEALAPQANAIGPTIVRKSLKDAIDADIVMLAVPFWQHREVAKARTSWQGKFVIDVTNAFGVPVEDLGGLPSSTVIARPAPRSIGQGVQPFACGRSRGRPRHQGRTMGCIPVER
jgi:predicted dinucleotide-binding enzyme